jgi:hypothetical protein
MPEWWTYGLSDFLLFSPRTYFRLVELYHQAVWPAQIAAVALGIALFTSQFVDNRAARRVMLGLLALAWLWIAWSWFGQHYATINWAAPYAGWAFAAQALLLAFLAILKPARTADPVVRSVAIAVMLMGLLGLPLLGVFWAGRSVQQADLFGLDPDPTALVTISLLLAMRGWLARMAMVLPLMWCMIAGATLQAMDEPGAWFTPAVGFLGCLVAACYVWTARHGRAADANT